MMMSVGRQRLRKSHRKRSRYAAWINLGDHCQPVRCVLWDISDGGARLTAARNVEDLPDQFSLVLNDVVECSCRVVWRNARFLGVRFVKASAAALHNLAL
jgi:c-di-GMP-binding flagellar brake protein YcgR